VAMPLAPTRLVFKPELRKHERKIPKRYFGGHINIFITLVQPYNTHYCPIGLLWVSGTHSNAGRAKDTAKILKCVHLVGSSTTVSSRHKVTSSYGLPS
jgi:hypothetical protein